MLHSGRLVYSHSTPCHVTITRVKAVVVVDVLVITYSLVYSDGVTSGLGFQTFPNVLDIPFRSFQILYCINACYLQRLSNTLIKFTTRHSVACYSCPL
jgi:hypothetical protein